jgi:mannose-1-phosphate guanylyltransferase
MRGTLSRSRIHAVILAGGAGERFWPLSRRRRPKPFLRVVSEASLLRLAYERAARVATPARTWVVCGREHASGVARETGLPRRRLLLEPAVRNTAMAVAFAAARIAGEDPGAVLVVLPADHVIPDTAAFARAVQRAARAAVQAQVLVTLGVRPTRPETGYGYIRLGAPAGKAHPGLRRVSRFVEKPGVALARRWLRQGGYLWNSGVFVWTARTILEEIEACAPELHRLVEALQKRRRGSDGLEKAYRKAPVLPIDQAVLEQSRRVWTLPVDFHWNDLGTWSSVAGELGVGRDASRVIGGGAMLLDAPGNLVVGRDRPVVLFGVEGLAVIDAGDALLVTRLSRSSELRRVVRSLRERGREDLL